MIDSSAHMQPPVDQQVGWSMQAIGDRLRSSNVVRAAVIAGSLVLAGCGGDSDPTTPTTTPNTPVATSESFAPTEAQDPPSVTVTPTEAPSTGETVATTVWSVDYTDRHFGEQIDPADWTQITGPDASRPGEAQAYAGAELNAHIDRDKTDGPSFVRLTTRREGYTFNGDDRHFTHTSAALLSTGSAPTGTFEATVQIGHDPGVVQALRLVPEGFKLGTPDSETTEIDFAVRPGERGVNGDKATMQASIDTPEGDSKVVTYTIDDISEFHTLTAVADTDSVEVFVDGEEVAEFTPDDVEGEWPIDGETEFHLLANAAVVPKQGGPPLESGGESYLNFQKASITTAS